MATKSSIPSAPSCGARAEDAVNKAGGLTADAVPEAVNLAAHVEDGQQLRLPTKKEIESGIAPASPSISATNKNAKPAKGTKTVNSAIAHSGYGKSNKLSSPTQGTVNLNTASIVELQKIPGVGPAMAEKLLQFRNENGGFKSVDDLLQIPGIGDKKFAKMQPFTRVR